MQQTQKPDRLPNETDEQYDIRVNKDVAAFSYVWIMSVVVYGLRAKESPFVKYHSRQAIVLFIVSIVVWLVPFIGGYLVFLPVAGMLLGFINAAQGRLADVPFAGPLSRGEMTLKDIWAMVSPYVQRAVEAIRHTFTKTGTAAETKAETKPADAPTNEKAAVVALPPVPAEVKPVPPVPDTPPPPPVDPQTPPQ